MEFTKGAIRGKASKTLNGGIHTHSAALGCAGSAQGAFESDGEGGNGVSCDG